MGLVDGWRGMRLWKCWRERMRQLAWRYRLRADYLKIAGMPSQMSGSWMTGAMMLPTLSEKEVETVGSAPCQGEISD
ncbi:MAG: hypothetical protein ABSC17_07595 [Thermacetogeniaceae bacterium]